MDKQIFRQTSIDRISSPEQLHDYIRVTSPRLWMLLTAIIVLVGGLIIAACTMNLENKLAVKVTVTDSGKEEAGEAGDAEDTHIYMTLPLDQKDNVQIGMKVRFAGTEGSLVYFYENNQELRASVKTDEAGKQLPEGQYDGELIIDTVTPIKYLLN